MNRASHQHESLWPPCQQCRLARSPFQKIYKAIRMRSRGKITSFEIPGIEPTVNAISRVKSPLSLGTEWSSFWKNNITTYVIKLFTPTPNDSRMEPHLLDYFHTRWYAVVDISFCYIILNVTRSAVVRLGTICRLQIFERRRKNHEKATSLSEMLWPVICLILSADFVVSKVGIHVHGGAARLRSLSIRRLFLARHEDSVCCLVCCTVISVLVCSAPKAKRVQLTPRWSIRR